MHYLSSPESSEMTNGVSLIAAAERSHNLPVSIAVIRLLPIFRHQLTTFLHRYPHPALANCCFTLCIVKNYQFLQILVCLKATIMRLKKHGSKGRYFTAITQNCPFIAQGGRKTQNLAF